MKWYEDIEKLTVAIAQASNGKQVLAYMGMNNNPGNYTTLQKYCRKYGLEIPRWTGEDQTRAATIRVKIPFEEMFVDNSTSSTGNVKRAIIRDKLLPLKCSASDCAISDIWLSKPIVLVLDHIDGNKFNNQLSNLRFLCPNCNSQQDTFCRSNKDKKDKKYNYCECGSKISATAVRCHPCSGKHQAPNRVKIDWPSDPQEVWDFANSNGFVAAGRRFDCTDNAVRKFLRRNFDKLP